MCCFLEQSILVENVFTCVTFECLIVFTEEITTHRDVSSSLDNSLAAFMNNVLPVTSEGTAHLPQVNKENLHLMVTMIAFTIAT